MNIISPSEMKMLELLTTQSQDGEQAGNINHVMHCRSKMDRLNDTILHNYPLVL